MNRDSAYSIAAHIALIVIIAIANAFGAIFAFVLGNDGIAYVLVGFLAIIVVIAVWNLVIDDSDNPSAAR